ncbi:F510_1955 family glycosylhydrolase [Rossellomorea sp. YZS02]|uniref:F510_1955 family glycosylhydrolase n=1 Tax=Rossellomorea sp. YZS02 TaxID=3097358 RepID=UPI002A0AEE25|nr:YCF48-related protein [Rossellomorea sp. YZS02]MDX8344306.1 YCF48-related protein [Rossellomorea sp. YZS02]
MKHIKTFFLVSSLAIMVSGCSATDEDYSYVKTEDKTIDHIHGMGYPNNKGELVIATHDGLMKYKDSTWYETNSEKHDYMGFQPYKDGFYSSGHPEEGSKLKNPLGLVKSTDGGKSLDKLAFYGETDFHYLGAGYQSKALYAINQESNSEMDTGLYRSMDEGENWKKADMKGFDSTSIGNIAVHPSKKEMLAISSKDGVFVSQDGGDSFTKVENTQTTTSIYLTEKTGLFASIEKGKIQLYELNLDSNKIQSYPTPDLSQDNPIMYISSNPERSDEWTIVTYNNDIFQSTDNDETWNEVVDEGKLAK